MSAIITVKCKQCGKEKTAYRSSKRQFCSIVCRSESRRKIITEEDKRKVKTEYQRLWRAKNRQHNREYQRNYMANRYAENPDKQKEYNTRYRRNKELLQNEIKDET